MKEIKVATEVPADIEKSHTFGGKVANMLRQACDENPDLVRGQTIISCIGMLVADAAITGAVTPEDLQYAVEYYWQIGSELKVENTH